tara:strand:+ start:1657 stop:2136 length:480 start_codon:yes stop_codon:yes gene_type:complete
MPCTKCKDGKYKWGKTGECKYDTKEACEKANPKKYSNMIPTPLGKKSYEEYEKELKEFNLSKVERVELSLVSEFKSEYNKAIKKSLSLGEEVATFSSKKNDLESEVNKNISDFEKLQKPYNAIVKQAKELGININDVLDDRPNIGQDIKSMKDALKLLK